MKLRIMSDLHLYINRNYAIELEDKDMYTLIAGDIGPEYKNNSKWIRENIHNGAFISGNHDAYTFDNTPLEDVKEYYHKEFPLEGNVTYFDYDVGVISKMLDKNTMLIADVLYTDYEYKIDDYDKKLVKNGRNIVEMNMSRALPKFSGTYMNDFLHFTRNGTYVKDEYSKKYDKCPEGCFYLKPQNYLNHFNLAFKEIDKLVKENKDKNIVLMTHHCISPKCMTNEMRKYTLTASYVSDKTKWIISNKNIKLIISGHIHNQLQFKIGNALYVMNPRGYCPRNEDWTMNKNKTKTYWTPDVIVDTENWTVERKEFNNEEIEKRHEKENAEFLKYSSLSI